MILPSFTDSQILKELLEDYASVRKLMKKDARKHIDSLKKKKQIMLEEETIPRAVKTANNNHWYYVIQFTPKEKTPWYGQTCCAVESEKGTKDYFLVRGFSDNKPYYIKITSHAVKRMIERNYKHAKEYGISSEMLVCMALDVHETVVGNKYVDLEYLYLTSKMEGVEDENEEMQYMFAYFRGIFFGYVTQNGNYFFKTFIEPSMATQRIKDTDMLSAYDKQGVNSMILITAHQYYNKSMYGKKELEQVLYSIYDKDAKVDFSHSPLVILKP